MTPGTASAERPWSGWGVARVGAAAVLVLTAATLAYVGLPLLGGAVRLTADQAALRAAAAYREGRFEDAGAYLLLAVERDPKHARARYMLAQLYEQTGRHAEAIREYRAAATLAPGDPAPHYNAALLLIAAGQPEEGLAEAEAALAAGMPAARIAVAAAYRKMNRWDQAAAACEGLLADEGRFPLDWFQVHLDCGDIEWDRGRLQQAKEHWHRAEALNPGHPEVRDRLSRLNST